jgi:single-strand DNA-binding protein
MARGVNKVILVGNVGKDPEVRYTQTGTAVATFSLATSDRIKRNDQWEDRTEWHNIVAWGRTAETCGQWVKKGTQLFVDGRIQTRKWQDRDGNNRYTTEIVVNQMLLLGRGQGQRPDAGQDSSPAGGARAPADDFPGPEPDDTGFDPNDDVPF